MSFGVGSQAIVLNRNSFVDISGGALFLGEYEKFSDPREKGFFPKGSLIMQLSRRKEFVTSLSRITKLIPLDVSIKERLRFSFLTELMSRSLAISFKIFP